VSLRSWTTSIRICSIGPSNDIEFSGERKRVRCNEGLCGEQRFLKREARDALGLERDAQWRRDDYGFWCFR
jgi:hypothetical protein